MNQYCNGFSHSGRQRGFALIEVMIAVFIAAVGLLGVAAMQLNALKFTDSAVMTTQANFIAYDVLDRMRANSTQLANYDLADTDSAPNSATDIRTQDLIDFATNVASLTDGTGSIDVAGKRVTVSIGWSEARAGGADAEGGIITITADITN